MRIPKAMTLSEIQGSLRDVETVVRPLENGMITLNGGRVTDAGKAVSPFDYVRKFEFDTELAKVMNPKTSSARPSLEKQITDVLNAFIAQNHGSYIPEITRVTNVASATAYTWYWSRFGNQVHVFGRIDIQPSVGGGTQTEVDFTLPIRTNLAHNWQCVGNANSNNLTSEAAAILGNGAATADQAAGRLLWRTVSNANNAYWAQFDYLVL